MKAINEVRIDIALNAGAMIANSIIYVNDSRELVNFINDIAKEFQKNYKPDIEYIEAVDEFAEHALSQKFGKKVG